MADDDFFAPPPFDAAQALVGLRRSLRDLRTLTERGAAFEWKGLTVIEAAAEDAKAIRLRLAKRPARSPEWETRLLKNGADVRSAVDEIKRRLARWKDAEE
ncbi:MAG TPA: hypothetical protein VLU41_13110 [Ideonella sp.]|nr:hypothetical protein [Ideonella sp.]